jgi:hypothetical protein
MAEAVIGPVPGRSLWYKVRAFLNAKLVSLFAGGLFTLLAIFLIYPIATILKKLLGR